VARLEHLSPQQAADLCGVSRSTLLRWLDDGHIPHCSTAGGWRRIPVADLVAFMREHGIAVPVELDGGPVRILLVDDEPAVTHGLRRVLHQALPQAEIHEVHDGFSAGIAAIELRPHVMILDLKMPGMDGFEVCVRLQRQPALRATAVVILSGHLDDEVEAELLALGVRTCLRKPVVGSTLLEALRPLLPA